MTGKQNQFIPGIYRQHILAGVIIAGHQPVGIDTHGGGTGADGSHLTATFGQQLMITLYDMAAATVYIQAWLADDHQWIFDGLPAEVPTVHGQGSIGPALSVRAHGEDDAQRPVRLGVPHRDRPGRVADLDRPGPGRRRLDARGLAAHRRPRPDHPGPAGTRPPVPQTRAPDRPLTGPTLPAPTTGAGGMRTRSPAWHPHRKIHPHCRGRARPGSGHDDSIEITTSRPATATRTPVMYTISTTPGGRVDTADTIPDALAALAAQLTDSAARRPGHLEHHRPRRHRAPRQRHPQRPARPARPSPSTNSSTSCTPHCTAPPTASVKSIPTGWPSAEGGARWSNTGSPPRLSITGG